MHTTLKIICRDSLFTYMYLLVPFHSVNGFILSWKNNVNMNREKNPLVSTWNIAANQDHFIASFS